MMLPGLKSRRLVAVFLWAGLFLPQVLLASNALSIPIMALAFFVYNCYVLFNPSIDQTLLARLGAMLACSLYVFVGVASVYWLRNNPLLLSSQESISFILLGCIATWSNDSFAFFGGRAFGKRPFFNSVSKNKTWEGFYAGAIGGIIFVLMLDLVSKKIIGNMSTNQSMGCFNDLLSPLFACSTNIV